MQDRLSDALASKLHEYSDKQDPYVKDLREILLDNPQFEEYALDSLNGNTGCIDVITKIKAKLAIIDGLGSDEELAELYKELEELNLSMPLISRIIDLCKRIAKNKYGFHDIHVFVTCSGIFHPLPRPEEDDSNILGQNLLRNLNYTLDKILHLPGVEELKRIIKENPMIRSHTANLVQIPLIQIADILKSIKIRLELINRIGENKTLLRFYKYSLENMNPAISSDIIALILEIEDVSKGDERIKRSINGYITKTGNNRLADKIKEL